MTRTPRFKLVAPVVREWPLHKQIVDTLRLEIAPPGRVSSHDVVWWSIDIAGYGGEVPGARMARGVVAGCPDMIFLYRGHAHFIEIKATDGIMSDAQKSVMTAILAAGGKVGVACSADDVLVLLDAWEIPRARRAKLMA